MRKTTIQGPAGPNRRYQIYVCSEADSRTQSDKAQNSLAGTGAWLMESSNPGTSTFPFPLLKFRQPTVVEGVPSHACRNSWIKSGEGVTADLKILEALGGAGKPWVTAPRSLAKITTRTNMQSQNRRRIRKHHRPGSNSNITQVARILSAGGTLVFWFKLMCNSKAKLNHRRERAPKTPSATIPTLIGSKAGAGGRGHDGAGGLAGTQLARKIPRIQSTQVQVTVVVPVRTGAASL
ncbi:hypothetical protein DFH08DRAFT_808087 [Mycena albidolilacea]|uniref:Uncharacterized protein n=1 Tax=Mycena albidolilacea TaxID=1033008 RepID=A0AAD7A2T5_9AGAR|nr:hypothetical protein DFH08DRAFT_808087 [Mycena albidolilacea]